MCLTFTILQKTRYTRKFLCPIFKTTSNLNRSSTANGERDFVEALIILRESVKFYARFIVKYGGHLHGMRWDSNPSFTNGRR